MSDQGPPRLRTLLGVQPVNQSQTRLETTVTVVSLERYAEGSLVTLWWRRPPGSVLPRLTLRATDDLGTPYQT